MTAVVNQDHLRLLLTELESLNYNDCYSIVFNMDQGPPLPVQLTILDYKLFNII